MVTKAKNLQRLREERGLLEAAIARLTREEITQPETCGPWSVMDVMAHVTSWEQHMLADYARLFAGEKCRAIKNAEIDGINEETFRKSSQTPLDEVRGQFERSYKEVEAWLENATEEQLAQRYLYGMTVGGFVKVDTWEHYAEHRKMIEQAFGRGSKG